MDLKAQQFQPSVLERDTSHYIRLPGASSSLALNAPRDGASTDFLGSLFQCLATLCVKNFLLMSNISFPSSSLKLFLFVLYYQTT